MDIKEDTLNAKSNATPTENKYPIENFSLLSNSSISRMLVSLGAGVVEEPSCKTQSSIRE